MSQALLLTAPPEHSAEAATTGDQAGQTGQADQADRFDRAKTCRFASHCSCVFQRVQQSDEPVERASYSDSVKAEIMTWELRGFVVVSAGRREVVLEKGGNVGAFCLNLFLSVLTVFVWAVVWAVRSRTTTLKTTVLTVDENGEFGRADQMVAAKPSR